MKCTYDKEQFTRLLIEPADAGRLQELEAHLADCADCRQEFAAMKKLWVLMDEVAVPKPPASIKTRFSAILEDYKVTQQPKNSLTRKLLKRLQPLLHIQPRLQLGYSLLILVLGLGLGYLADRSLNNAGKKQIDTLSAQVEEMKEMMMMSLLENPSASERMRAISYATEIKDVNRQVADALLATLNNDPNVNVRLITLEALANLANDPVVREGLVHSIVQQQSPLVQSALADVMVKLQEKKSVKPLQKLLHKKGLNDAIKVKIQESLHKLI